MVGTRSRTGYYNFIIHAPGLHQAHDHGPGVVYWQINPAIPSILANMDEGDLWSFGPTVAIDDNGMSAEEVVALVQRATGIDLPYKIGWRVVWNPSRALAHRSPQGRLLLASHSRHL